LKSPTPLNRISPGIIQCRLILLPQRTPVEL
jgi:hypothetical protein